MNWFDLWRLWINGFRMRGRLWALHHSSGCVMLKHSQIITHMSFDDCCTRRSAYAAATNSKEIPAGQAFARSVFTSRSAYFSCKCITFDDRIRSIASWFLRSPGTQLFLLQVSLLVPCPAAPRFAVRPHARCCEGKLPVMSWIRDCRQSLD